MANFWANLWRAFRRVWPACVTQAQAVAFNMFLAFFPMLLLVMGLVSRWDFLRDGADEMFNSTKLLMPPGMYAVLSDFLARHAEHPLSWASVGLVGTLLAGMQMMRLMLVGFHMAQKIEHPKAPEQFLRGLILLIVTLVPTVLAIAIAVFGKSVRIIITEEYGAPIWMRVRRWSDVIPGAIVATPLWWIASWTFGIYMRHVPYNLIYGGLATAIGVMIWMNFTVIIIFLGAAYNAERNLPSPRTPAPAE
jgi:membrane protein